MKQISRITLIIVLALGMAAVAACGRKGALLPPEALAPGAVESFRVLQKGEKMQLSWSPPTREQGGRPLRDLAGFSLLKREVLPQDIDCSSCPDSWQLLHSVELDFPAGVKKVGNVYIYLDSGVTAGTTVQYRLLALGKNGGSSLPATTAPRRKLLPIPPPLLQATAAPTAIRLTFVPQPAAAGEAASFNIYRRQPGEPPAPFPLNPAPINAKEWQDQQLQYGKTYLYTATALDGDANAQVESDPSNEVEMSFTTPELK